MKDVPSEIWQQIVYHLHPWDYEALRNSCPLLHEMLSSEPFVHEYTKHHKVFPERLDDCPDFYFQMLFSFGWPLYHFLCPTEKILAAAVKVIIEKDDLQRFLDLELQCLPIDWTTVEKLLGNSGGKIVSGLMGRDDDRGKFVSLDRVATAASQCCNMIVLRILDDNGVVIDWDSIRSKIHVMLQRHPEVLLLALRRRPEIMGKLFPELAETMLRLPRYITLEEEIQYIRPNCW